MENKEFNYTYKALTEQQRREIEAIKRQYEPPKTEYSRLERLRRLNSLVNGTATALSLVAGIVGLMIFGLGLAMVLEWGMILWGVIVAIVSLLPIGIAYPTYTYFIKRGKARYGEEILRLSSELLNESIN